MNQFGATEGCDCATCVAIRHQAHQNYQALAQGQWCQRCGVPNGPSSQHQCFEGQQGLRRHYGGQNG